MATSDNMREREKKNEFIHVFWTCRIARNKHFLRALVKYIQKILDFSVNYTWKADVKYQLFLWVQIVVSQIVSY